MDLLIEFASNLRRNQTRSLLTVMGLALGAGCVVFLASMLASAEIALDRMSQAASGSDMTHILKEATVVPQSRTTRELGERDARTLAAHEGLDSDGAIPSRTLLGRDAAVGRNRTTISIQSGGAELARMTGLVLERGRWLVPEEDGLRQCMVGHDVWTSLWNGQWPLPQKTITLDDGTELVVVGVFAPRPAPGAGGGDETWRLDRRLWVSTPTFVRAVDPSSEADDIVLRHPAVDGAAPDLTAIAQRLTPLLEGLHRGVRNFSFDSVDKSAQLGNLVVTALTAILLSCGFVAMVVGGVNVMNAELVMLQERTKEFGIRRALGLSARRLQREVLLETCLLTLLSGGAGVGLGLAGAWLLSAALTAWFTEWPVRIVGWSIPAALGASLVAGVFAGWLPARRAASIVPATCLAEG